MHVEAHLGQPAHRNVSQIDMSEPDRNGEPDRNVSQIDMSEPDRNGEPDRSEIDMSEIDE